MFVVSIVVIMVRCSTEKLLSLRSREDRLAAVLSVVYFFATFIMGKLYVQRDDAAVHILRSQFIYEYGHFPFNEYIFDSSSAYVYPPVFHIMGAISNLLTGHYTVAPAFSGALSIFLTYQLFTLWHDQETGLYSALALAVNPMFFLWSGRMYVGTTITAGFLLTFVLYFRYLKTDSSYYLYAAFIVGGGLATVKTYGPAAAGIVLFHRLWTQRDDLWNTIRTVAPPLTVGVIASLPWPIRNLIRTGSLVPRSADTIPAGAPTPEPVQSGIFLYIPTPTEIRLFFARGLGIVPPELTTEHLGSVYPVLPFVWLVLPLSLLVALAFGSVRERDNSFVWIWIAVFPVLYTIQRVLTGGGVAFKYRHFVTLTPLLALFAVHAYRRISVSDRTKKVVVAALVILLFAQMGGAAVLQSEHTKQGWDPLVTYTEDNIQHDEVIYYQAPRNLAYRIDDEYKVITTAYKPGYITPGGNFTAEIQHKADWVIVGDHSSDTTKSNVEAALSAGVLTQTATIDATRPVKIAHMRLTTIGRQWQIYRVTNKTTTPDPEPKPTNLDLDNSRVMGSGR